MLVRLYFNEREFQQKAKKEIVLKDIHSGFFTGFSVDFNSCSNLLPCGESQVVQKTSCYLQLFGIAICDSNADFQVCRIPTTLHVATWNVLSLHSHQNAFSRLLLLFLHFLG